MLKKLGYIISLLIAWFFIHITIIIIDGLSDDTGKANLAVIFGNTVNEDGSLSPRLKARVDRGLKLYKDSLVSKLIVSGGFGREGHFEGSKMANYLISKGVSADSIIIDNEGDNSYLTAINTKKIAPLAKSIIVVTQYHHITRAKLAMSKVGFENVYGVHCDYFEASDFLSIIREFFAYYKYLIVY